MISAMMRLVRGTPVVRGLASAIALLLGVCGIVPVAAYLLLRLDAASYEPAIGNAAKQCQGDPIPARGGCWSAAAARVVITGVDAQSGAAFVVVEVAGQPAMREDFVSAPAAGIAVGTTLTARYWHDSIATLQLAGADKAKPPTALPTRDSPSFRAQSLPVGGALLVLLGLGGLLVWGRPLLDDVRALRARRRNQAEAEIAVRESAINPAANRGLARYGMDVVLTGHRATPTSPTPAPPAATQSQGGEGWNVRGG
jgi:hypothetical protein